MEVIFGAEKDGAEVIFGSLENSKRKDPTDLTADGQSLFSVEMRPFLNAGTHRMCSFFQARSANDGRNHHDGVLTSKHQQ